MPDGFTNGVAFASVWAFVWCLRGRLCVSVGMLVCVHVHVCVCQCARAFVCLCVSV